MKRINGIERIFQNIRPYEASLPVVHMDKKEGNHEGGSVIDVYAAANQRLFDFPLSQKMNKKDKADASDPIVRLEKIRHNENKSKKDKVLCAPLSPESLGKRDGKQTEEERKEHVLRRKKEHGPVVAEVPRDL